MHISLDSALGQQRRLNQVGETISSIAAPAAAYSLRSLTGGDPKVVRVRRESDNNERDFTASEVSSGALTSFVNAQVTAPLDIQQLTATGRDGDFLIAKAAYSLRSLGTRQATVSATGDTVARADGKYVCQVRSVTGDVKSFTADEVSDGTLVDFVLGNTKSLLNSRAYFDGSNDEVDLTSDIDLTGDFSIQFSFVVTVKDQRILGKKTAVFLAASGNNEIESFKGNLASSAFTLTLTSNLKYGEENTVKFKRVSGKIGIYNESDTLISNEITTSETFTVNSFGKARGQFGKGVIHSIRIDTNGNGTIDHSYNGYGNSVSDWTDLVGSNNASAVDGSPALFAGQDQDGFVKTWYDQSVDQAGTTATGNHATQTTAASQPKIVDAGSLLTKGLTFDGTDDFLRLTSTLGQTDVGSYFSVLELDTTNSSKAIVDNRDSANDGSTLFHQTGSFRFKFLSTTETVASTSTSQLIASGFKTSTKTSLGVNGAALEETSSTSTISVSTLPTIGGRSFSDAANFMDGEIAEIIIYNTDESDNRTAIEANIGEHYGIDLPSGVDPLNNEVNGFVETWYDQSGNGRDSTNTTAAQQPIIVESGVFQDGLKFTHTDTTNGKRLFVPRSAAELGDAFGLVFVGKVTVSDSSTNTLLGGIRGVQGYSPGTAGIAIKSSSGEVRFVNEADSSTRVISTSSTTVSLDTDFVAFATYEDGVGGPDLDLSVNGNNQDFGFGSAFTLTSSKDIGIMNATGNNTSSYRIEESPTGICREILVYDTFQESNRVAIETNIISHYGIS